MLKPESRFQKIGILRILVADDHAAVRRHVCNVLQSEEGWEVCGEAKTGREAVTMTAAQHPDVVVLDLSMPDLTGLQAAQLIHEQSPGTEMIMLTMHESYDLMDQLTAAGVQICIPKTDLQRLVTAVREMRQSGRASEDQIKKTP